MRRGFSITILHINLNKNKLDFIRFFVTIVLACIFLIIQIREYKNMFFNFSDSLFGRIFFFSTGFHGFHVFLGLIFLIINFIRYFKLNIFNFKNIQSLEFSIIY